MGRHQWAQSQDPGAGDGPPGRIRLLLGRGALVCVVLAVLGWLAVSLLVQPRGDELEPLAEVPLNRSEILPTPAPATADGQDTGQDTGPPAPGGPVEPSDQASVTAPTIMVHVVGAVKRPGVYTLPATVRAYQAIEAAGGLAANADPAALNLAAGVHDAQQLYVPRKGEPARAQEGPKSTASEGPAPDPGGPPGASAAGVQVNVNTADSAGLQGLPGIGPVLAGNIVDFRTANGPFTSLADLDAVSGIGPVLLKRLEPLVVFK